MSIVVTEIESIHGPTAGKHMVFYRCQDHTGAWHSFGPVNAEPGFDRETYKPTVAAIVAASLAEQEAESLVGV